MKKNLIRIVLLAAAVALGVDLGAGQTTQLQSPPDPTASEGGVLPMGWGRNSQPGFVTGEQQPSRRHLAPDALPLGVRRRVPQDYSTIQAAINASADGDTVLVSEGTYLENIRYRGKAITVASLYLIDGDTSHITHTIIDGSSHAHPDSGSVVYFIDGEDTTSVLCGLTIRGGSGTVHDFQGVPYREGGGIYVRGSGARIAGNIISHNRIFAQNSAGGGITGLDTGVVLPLILLEGNHITDNRVEGSGGTYGTVGGGVCLAGVTFRVVGNLFERDTVVAQTQADGGGFFLQAIDASHPRPSGLIKDNDFRANITQASANGAVGAGACLVWTGEVTIEENLFENNAGTSISGWAQGGGLCVSDQEITVYGRKLIVRNRFVNNRVTHGGTSTGSGGGIILYKTLATLDANEISDNIADATGGGIFAYMSAFRFQNNIITGNTTTTSGAGCAVAYGPLAGTERVMVNNTIVDNQAGYYGGGLAVSGGGPDLVVLNNIVWGNNAQNYTQIYAPGTTANVNYCDVQGGYAGTGNINAPPLFAAGQYSLSDASPCIGRGVDSINIGGIWYRAPGHCIHGSIRPNPPGSSPDLGACENLLADPIIEVREGGGSLPTSVALEQNYPNPFNPTTIIEFRILNSELTILKVFDLLAREVGTLVNEVKEPGTYTVQWDANGVSSGVYFYRLRVGDFVQTKRMLILR
jgi:hypothetical protein